MSVIIEVTQEHIDKGKENNLFACPIALALKDANIADDIAVTTNTIILDGYQFDSPLSVKRFVMAFDEQDEYHEYELNPFSFELDIDT